MRTEERVLHKEWTDIILDFDELKQVFSHSDDADEDPPTWDHYPTLVFENGSIAVDESWGFKDGRLYTSSHASGVMDWNGTEYVRHYHFCPTNLGQFVEAEFHESDDLIALLKKHGVTADG